MIGNLGLMRQNIEKHKRKDQECHSGQKQPQIVFFGAV
jgi:hypothetical protein